MSADYWRDCPKCKAEEQFREDYEFYMEDGVVHAAYHGQCQECGVKTTFHHKHYGLADIKEPSEDG